MINFRKKSKNSEEENRSDMDHTQYILPLISVSDLIIGPHINTVIDIDKKESLQAINAAAKQSHLICFAYNAYQNNSDQTDIAKKICCIADIKDMLRMSDNSVRIHINGIRRAKIVEYVTFEPYVTVRVDSLVYPENIENNKDNILSEIILERYIKYITLIGQYDSSIEKQFEGVDPDEVVDKITSNLPLTAEEYYTIMELDDTQERLKKTIETIANLTNIAEVEFDLEKQLVLSLSNEQKIRYLREKKQIIDKELSEDDQGQSLDDYRDKLQALPLSDEYKKRLLKEMDRFEMTPMGSQEASVIQSYLDYILDLPWEICDGEDFDIQNVSKILDEDHYGLTKVKERILEYLSVIKLTSSLKSPILCLVGPPGVGKTSIAKSIARATERKFVRVSLGGMHDEAEIRGHRKTYVGAMPGRIISGLRQVQSKNPVFLLDEIDKLTRNMRGDPASALLEALDPEQNSTFTDTYIEVPFDLSEVMFITTANVTSTIPAPLLDRMEIIEIPGYMANEKLEIAKRHLVTKQLKLNGITEDNLQLSDDVLYEIIHNYTRESGVRQLERSIAALCRKAAKNLVIDQQQTLDVTIENLHQYLGRKVHSYDIVEDKKIQGVVNGLAWTSTGGDVLEIEAAIAKGNGKLELTGKMGDVMKESAKTSIGHIRSNANEYAVEDIEWDKIDIHIHIPEGAVPKDGPSAGITMTTALISALSKREVSQKLAMTGEITLSGKVLPIGGLREKLLAANRAKITEVIIPTENEKDLEDIPEKILDELKIYYADRMEDVYDIVFLGLDK